jgi:hypothetical protein
MKAVQLINTNVNVAVSRYSKGEGYDCNWQRAVQRPALRGVSVPLIFVTAMLVRDPLAAAIYDAQQHLPDCRWGSLDCCHRQ